MNWEKFVGTTPQYKNELELLNNLSFRKLSDIKPILLKRGETV